MLLLILGLLRTMEEIPRHGLVVMFTDHKTKDLHLEARLLELIEEKELRVVVVLVPRYYGKVGDQSWSLYMNVSAGRTFNMKDFSEEHLLEQVAGLMEEPCAPGEGVVSWSVNPLHAGAAARCECSGIRDDIRALRAEVQGLVEGGRE